MQTKRMFSKWVVLLGLVGACGVERMGSRYVKSVPVAASEGALITVSESENAELAGAQLDLPRGALPGDLTVTVELGLDALGEATLAASPVAIFGPEDTVLSEEATLVLPLRGLEATEELAIITRTATTEESEVDPSLISPSSDRSTVTVRIRRLGRFQAVRRPSLILDGGSPRDGGGSVGLDGGSCAGAGVACTSRAPGICRPGVTVCTGVIVQCESTIAPGARAETCNGVDDDCDGLVDEGCGGGDGGTPPRDGGSVIITDGGSCAGAAGLSCTSSAPGICRVGLTVCTGSVLSCEPTVAPGAQAETCNGLDDDCDGLVDEGFSVGAACTSSSPGICRPGTVTCTAGFAACKPNIAPGVRAETCNAVDDDCDGLVDEVCGGDGGTAPVDGGSVIITDGGSCAGAAGLSCTSSAPGICRVGLTVCTGSVLSCEPTVAPGVRAESCNGLDDDCDGSTDEGVAGVGVACTSVVPGVCGPGIQTCTSGGLVCTPNILPGTRAETCNGLDDDCDGLVDEGCGDGGTAPRDGGSAADGG